MAHFAQIDENNKVVQVVVVPNDQEHRGEEYLAIDCGLSGRWIQTSFNANIRKAFAGIGYTYDEEDDCFIPLKPQHQPYLVFNEELWKWDYPTPRPNDGKEYSFNEDTLVWEELTPAE